MTPAPHRHWPMAASLPCLFNAACQVACCRLPRMPSRPTPNTAHRPRRVSAYALLAVAVACVAPQRSVPQGARDGEIDRALNRQVSIPVRASTFQGAIDGVCSAGHVSVLADGLPIVKTAAMAGGGSVRDVLGSICQAFDYRWTSPKPGVILLRKRFSDRQDRPQFVVPELRQTARDIRNVLPDVAPSSDHAWSPMVVALAESMGVEQQTALLQGRALPVTSLRADQQRMVERITAQRLYGAAKFAVAVWLAQLDAIDASWLRLVTLQSSPVIGGDAPRWSVEFVTRGGGGCEAGAWIGYARSVDAPAKSSPSDSAVSETGVRHPMNASNATRAQPADDEQSALDTLVSLTPGYVTVRAFLAEVSAQAGLRIEPAAHAADRRIFQHIDGMPARRAIAVLCELNDWQWRREKAGVYRVGRFTMPRPTSRAAIREAVRRAIPPDLRRFLHFRDLDAAASQPKGEDTSGAREAQVARDRLVAAVAPRLARGEAGRWKDLSAAEREDLLLVLMAASLHELEDLTTTATSVADQEPGSTVVSLWWKNTLLVLTGMIDDGKHKGASFGTNVTHVPWVRDGPK